MRVLIISANTERINMMTLPLGAAMVAAATRAHGHVVELLDLLKEREPEAAVARAIAEHDPQVIGISVRNIDDQDRARPTLLIDPVRRVVAACRASSHAHVVLGGAGYSIFPEPALRFLGADYGIAGEGERALPAFLSALGSGSELRTVARFYPMSARGPCGGCSSVCLDELVFPADDLLRRVAVGDPTTWIPYQTRRGCPLDCSYCSTALIEGRMPRRRTPQLVAHDISQLVERGARRIHFVDNTFNLPPWYALELCRLIRVLPAPPEWRCIVYPYRISPELVDAMATAGCVEVSLGAESGNRQILRSMNKRFEPEDVRSASAAFAAAGIKRTGFLLLGTPGETRDTAEESMDFVDSLGLDVLKVTVGARVYPSTPLADRALAEGVIEADDDLLYPRFYLAPAVRDWIEGVVEHRSWTATAVC